jgi:calmodulin
MTQYFTKDQIDEFRQCFHLYASDGFVSNDSQLRYILRSLGCCPTVAETKGYIKRFGHNVDFAKFLEIIHLEEQKPDPIQEITKAFSNFQKSRGFIHKSELGALLNSFGEKMGKEEIAVIFRAMKIEGEIVPIAKISQYLQ